MMFATRCMNCLDWSLASGSPRLLSRTARDSGATLALALGGVGAIAGLACLFLPILGSAKAMTAAVELDADEEVAGVEEDEEAARATPITSASHSSLPPCSTTMDPGTSLR